MLPSLIRTAVPVIVGALLGYAAKVGLDLPSGAVTEIVTVAITTAYYALIRAGEKRFPQLGVLLGYAAQPEYVNRKKDLDKAA